MMQIGRLVMIVVVVAAALLDAVSFEVDRVRHDRRRRGLRCGVDAGQELVRWKVRSRGFALLTVGALIDVAFLTTVVITSGGLRSPFLVLCYLLVVVRTLLISYRSGLELAVLFAVPPSPPCWLCPPSPRRPPTSRSRTLTRSPRPSSSSCSWS